jgi:glyoxylase-like metal-dependent hydrolase (beta-lactamase superfamily II)
VRIDVGDTELLFVPDGEMRMRPTAVMQGSTDQHWAAHADLLDGDGRLPLSVGGLLIRTDRHTVLVDLGLGPVDAELPDGSGHLHGGRLLDALRELHVEPGAVDFVVFTHLHPDHVGWTTRTDHAGKRRLTFPNARHLVAPTEWSYWAERGLDPRGPDPDTVLAPLAGRFEPLVDGRQLVPCLTALATPGHTPGHLALELRSRDSRALLAGDVLHAPIQLERPSWTTMGDVDPELARRSRTELLERAADSGALVVVAHAGEQMLGTVDRHAGRLRWRPRPLELNGE